ncbi:MAG: DUF3795 domain-containing protein [Clostridia bacterium]|jgi:hypothetical protein|nr:DUF3795 domain-containing protein [Clostridia bacterium]
MNTICGADCGKCSLKENCKGCAETCGKPFGGTCVAAEYIKAGGKEKYAEFKQILLNEVNCLLKENNIPETDTLYDLQGFFINLAYPLPSGENVKFLDDKKIYLGTQIELADTGMCCGVAADTNFILVCSYGTDGSEPELIAYKKR